MKTLLTLMMVMLMTSTLAQGEHRTTINSLIMKADNIIYLLDDNSHMLRGRRNAEKRAEIDKVLEEAMKNIEGIIFQSSHAVTLPASFFETVRGMCRSTGTWSGDRACYVNGLQSETNLKVQIIMACNSISSDSGSSNCFHKALGMAANNANIYDIMYNSCRSTGTWSGDRACFNKAVENAGGFRNLDVLKGACDSISSDSGSSNCFHKGLGMLKVDPEMSMRPVIKNVCRSTGTWFGDRACYMNGLEPLRNEDVEIRLMLNSCSSITSTSGSANCFHKAL